MLKLDLKEAETGAALVLAAVIAGQVAEDMGQRACIQSLGAGSLGVTLEDASGRGREVFVAHLWDQLGQGFLLDNGEDGLVTISLDLADEADVTTGADAESEKDDGKAPVAEAAPKRRGRPPGSGKRATE